MWFCFGYFPFGLMLIMVWGYKIKDFERKRGVVYLGKAHSLQVVINIILATHNKSMKLKSLGNIL